jgi:hypothetical protein
MHGLPKDTDDNVINYRKEAKQLEKMFIEELQPFDEKGYNLKQKVDG